MKNPDEFLSRDHDVFGTSDRVILNTIEASEYLNCSASYLEKMRCFGGGPVYVKLGRSIRYRRSDIDKWLQASRFSNTAQKEASSCLH